MKNFKTYFIKYIIAITTTTSYTFAANIHRIKHVSDYNGVNSQLIEKQKQYKEDYIKSALAKTEFSILKDELVKIRKELIPMQRQIIFENDNAAITRVTQLKEKETLTLAKIDSILEKIKIEAASKCPTDGYHEFMKSLEKVRRDAIQDIEQTNMRILEIAKKANEDEKKLEKVSEKIEQKIEKLREENRIGREKVIQIEDEIKKMKINHVESLKKGLSRQERYQAEIEKQNKKLEEAIREGIELSESTIDRLSPTSPLETDTICMWMGLAAVASFFCLKKKGREENGVNFRNGE